VPRSNAGSEIKLIAENRANQATRDQNAIVSQTRQ
jgi:hypothetical protein